ncbi:putative heme peroxidase [Calothrix parasitica NIES-267]|uniref:Putative heme peroxidase n=1 Tax=Calothrix parasitica NIES-267 TaxID=1973488 RepID=A0A1Z4LTN6_9CYAN|nr:putative heme peroxidase [Calothrix parasitica NIES-267]
MQNPLINNNPFLNGDFEVQSIDGTGNNLQNPEYGAAETPLTNTAPLAYSNGFSTPTGQNRPNPRTISNAISQQQEDIPDPNGLTNLTWGFGQLLDHDLSLTPDSNRPINIQVPTGDPFLDPQGNGNVVIGVDDSLFIEGTGTDPSNPRQLPNEITAFIDGSNIYGSDEERTKFLRSNQGGKLKVSEGNLLPFNDGTVENDNPTRQDPTELFVAGDVRANENTVLTSIHTIFVREHNRIADELTQAHPEWSDEQLFQRARQINIAQYQSIIFNEYLPTLLGDDALSDYTGYNPNINPGIDRTFSNAAFRLGHTQLSSEIARLDNNGEVIPEGNLTLSEVFFPRGEVLQETGIDSILRGISSTQSQKVDNEIIDDVRNLLFGAGRPGTVSARDLAAINIQRGRHNGVADYNTVRESFGLNRVTSFAEITSDVEKQATLEELYGTVDDIDFFVGMLAEDLLPGASVGESVAAVLSQQFENLRDGDRFYYENVFSSEEIAVIESTTLSDIIRRNTDTTIIQDNAFSLINEGTSESEILNGGLGNDTIFGNGGDDIILGNAGNDTLSSGNGFSILDGGTGIDVADYSNLNEAIIFDPLGIVEKGFAGVDEIIDIETIRGASGLDNTIDGFFISDFGASITADLSSNSLTVNDEFLGSSTFTIENFQHAIGTTQDDVIIGNAQNNILSGEGGFDEITGGGGADTFVLGDSENIFYQGNGDFDFAFISDFTPGEDIIQLGAISNDYLFDTQGNQTTIESFSLDGTFDLIAVVSNTPNGISDSDISFV